MVFFIVFGDEMAEIEKERVLTLWGRVTHIYVSKTNHHWSDNALSPGRRQSITWTNAGMLLIGPLGTNFNEFLIEIQTFSSILKCRLESGGHLVSIPMR